MSLKTYLVAFYIFAGVTFLSHYAFSGHAVYGDGINYWSYLPSIYFDHDIDFTNQYKHYFEPINNNLENPKSADVVMKTSITDIGKTNNPHPPGAAIVWAPSFVAADVMAAIFSLPRQGYSDIYQIFAGLWSIGILTVGLWLNYQIIYRLIKDKNISLLSAFAVLLATPLLYYGSYDILNSHFASFTLTSFFWYILLFFPNKQKTRILLGAVAGVATLVRLQEAALLIPLVAYFILKKYPLRGLIVIILTWFIFISPLFFTWNYLYGIPLPMEYVVSFISTNNRGLLGSLFHPINGLIRTPIIFLSLFGLKQSLHKVRITTLLMGSYFIIQFIIISFQGGWMGSAYGGRMYISSLPFFAVLIAYTIKGIGKKFSFKSAVAVITILVIINIASILSFVFLEKEVNSGRKRGLEEKTQIKVERIIQRTKEYLY